jgi:hypothetical protein
MTRDLGAGLGTGALDGAQGLTDSGATSRPDLAGVVLAPGTGTST